MGKAAKRETTGLELLEAKLALLASHRGTLAELVAKVAALGAK